jgi:hypothetical protein
VEFLTISEASDVLTVWAHASVTPRQLRYLGLRSSWALDGARLIGPEELALMALFVTVSQRFRTWELPVWKARAVILYLETVVRAALRSRRPMVLALDPIRGTGRVQVATSRDKDAIALRPLLLEMTAKITARRAAEPEVWTGRVFDEEPAFVQA